MDETILSEEAANAAYMRERIVRVHDALIGSDDPRDLAIVNILTGNGAHVPKSQRLTASRVAAEGLTDAQLYAEFNRRKLEPCHGQTLADASDEQLRDEIWSRKAPGTRSDIASATDDQLRAEFRRRHGDSMAAKPGTSKDIGSAVRWELWTGDYVIVGKDEMALALGMVDERSRNEVDEWKRRAEAAEAKLAKAEGLVEGFLAGDKVTAADVEKLERRAARAECERGGTIAYALKVDAEIKARSRPDTSHYVDPWDFLADE